MKGLNSAIKKTEINLNEIISRRKASCQIRQIEDQSVHATIHSEERIKLSDKKTEINLNEIIRRRYYFRGNTFKSNSSLHTLSGRQV